MHRLVVFAWMLIVCCLGAEVLEMEPRIIPLNHPGRCRRAPQGVTTPREMGDKGFYIEISGHPEKYQPGEVYTITLQGFTPDMIAKKFIGFMLVVVPKVMKNDISSRPDVGTFQLFKDAMIKYSDECPNAIEHTSLIPKQQIRLKWKAPPAGSGCVVFKGMVQENREVWFMDEGGLIQELCEEEQESQDEQPPIIEDCCACNEAKYELIFEGLWSRHTHPKDFPENEWLTSFSDIIGASHNVNFRMWEYGGYATEGVKEVAEKGKTKKLESELKTESNKIRTIVKAKGLWYPHVQGKTFAMFRVDKYHHLISILSTLGPSPDWIVGVSALELCLKNCSWVAERVMNLYPWDAGTDSGMTYTSRNIPSIPQEKIRRITASTPNNLQSPFYDPSGEPMKPVARLTVTRQRVYDKNCSDYEMFGYSTAPYTNPERNSSDCRVTEWSEFQPCSVTCGKGIQMRWRQYKNKQKAELKGCNSELVQQKICEEPCIGNVSCRTSEWGEWSDCSVTCGKGLRNRSRKYLDNRARKSCTLELMEKETCMKAPCAPTPRPVDPKCPVTHWSEWSPCTVTCGTGYKVRTRLYLRPASSNMCTLELAQKEPCTAEKEDCSTDITNVRKICMQSKEIGPCRGYFPRWFYDVNRRMCLQFIYGGCRGNENNFDRYADCHRTCELALSNADSIAMNTTSTMQPYTDSMNTAMPLLMSSSSPLDVIDCVVSNWSNWTPCSRTCGNGRKERRRVVKQNPENGGQPCPGKLVQKRKCKENPPCPN
ncbi:spondin-1-like [Argiope bruennichi]|uniref:Spondin-1 n=1 Tax=Argiope bruennichi TaxID=94029 RepID=A0A8T0EEG1_ARGBR|nr:spondin-1-like [Argiope bruennichi]KAF8771040.1 Spondin-1 like protein [Argiope bruennichi]